MYLLAISLLFLAIQPSYCQSVYALSKYICIQESRSEFVQLGDHIVAEFLECEHIDDYQMLESVLRDAAQQAGATVINIVIHQFCPQGMSGLVLLAESHISIHTWPEHGYVAVDTYTCGAHVRVQTIIDVLQAFFKPKKIRQILIDRGYDNIDEEVYGAC
jgi:S-adenosylmethionine decarboxylase